ncbi:MAG: XdhC family protein, partial [Gemmatimonadales bacterium]
MTSNLIRPDDPALRDEPVVALATLVAATGSTSKKLGAKMIVGASGRLIGGVTIGGCVDAQVIEAADALVAGGAERRLLSISLDDDEAWDIGLTCGGTVDVLLQRVHPSDADDPVVAAHRRAAELVDAGEGAVIVTPLDAGAVRTVAEPDAPTAAGDRVFLDRVAPTMTLV